jgi:hypothetical protein
MKVSISASNEASTSTSYSKVAVGCSSPRAQFQGPPNQLMYVSTPFSASLCITSCPIYPRSALHPTFISCMMDADGVDYPPALPDHTRSRSNNAPDKNNNDFTTDSSMTAAIKKKPQTKSK